MTTSSTDNGHELPFVLTVREAAEVLRVDRNLAYELCRQGVIPHVRLGNRIRIRRDALLAWLVEREHVRPVPSSPSPTSKLSISSRSAEGR